MGRKLCIIQGTIHVVHWSAVAGQLRVPVFTYTSCCRLDEIIVFRQLTKGEVKQIADIMLNEVFKRAEEKEIKIDVTERFKVLLCCRNPG